jgi:hypothetical protein
LEVHAFNRDVDDTSQRVAEKAVAMNTEDVGRDLMAVEQLQRKQEALERDMTAIEGKLKVKLQYTHDSEISLAFCITVVLMTVQLLESDPTVGYENSPLYSVMIMFRVACCEHGPR